MSAEFRFLRFSIIGRFDAIVIETKPVLIFEELLSRTTLDFALYSADLAVGYQLSNNPKFDLHAFAELRLLHVKTGINTVLFGAPLSADLTKSYYDPVIATRVKYSPHYRWEFMAYTDVTPVPLQGNISFQGISVFSYHVNPHFSSLPAIDL